MKVRVYQGGLRIVEKSGIGKAIHHQIEMLKEEGAAVTAKNEKDVQIVHINTVFPDSPLTAALSRRRGQKVVVYAHSTEEDFRNSFKFSNVLAPLFKRWICFCYNRGDVIITPTPYSGRLLKSYGIRKPIFPLSNGIDTDAFCPSEEAGRKFRKKYGLKENEKVVMSVGHYIARKGIQEFIELARRMPDVRFFWFGYTSLKLVPDEIRKAIESAPENLTLPGFVNAEELHEAYCGCDLFAFLSHEETEGIVVLEALSSGIPVLVRDIPVYEEWLQDGVNVYKASDSDEFEEKIQGILDGSLPDTTDEGRKTALDRSFAAIGKHLVNIYHTMSAKTEKTERKTRKNQSAAAAVRLSEGRSK